MEYEDRYFLAGDGLRLHARIYEPKHAATGTVACLPGLSRNARDFHGFASWLSHGKGQSKRVIVFDYRGRGLSQWDAEHAHYNVIQEAEDVIAGLTAFGVDQADFVGTSRGGIIVMFLSAMRPTLMRRIVLNDIGPVIEGPGLMQIKLNLENSPAPKDWADAANIQKAMYAREFPVLTNADWDIHARAIYSENDKKKIIAGFDPGLLKSIATVDPSVPLPTMWKQFTGLAKMPLMVLRGEHSKLLSEETVAEMARRHPGMERLTIAGQGHAPMLWTADLPVILADFLSEERA